MPLKAVEAAPTTVAGVGAGIVAGIVTRNPFIGAGITGVAFGVLSAGEIFDEAVRADVPPERALKIAKLAGAGEAALEFVPSYMFMRLLGITRLSKTALKEGVRELNRALKIAKGTGTIAVAEAIEEGLQTAKDNLIAKNYYEPERKLTQGVLESAAVGGIMGGVLGGAGSVVSSKASVKAVDSGLDFSKLTEEKEDFKAMFEEAAPLEAIQEEEVTLDVDESKKDLEEEGVVTDTDRLARGVEAIQDERQARLFKNVISEEGKGTGKKFEPFLQTSEDIIKEEAVLIKEEILKAVPGENLYVKDEFNVIEKIIKGGVRSTFPPYYQRLKIPKRH